MKEARRLEVTSRDGTKFVLVELREEGQIVSRSSLKHRVIMVLGWFVLGVVIVDAMRSFQF